jgi:hypothetical protein
LAFQQSEAIRRKIPSRDGDIDIAIELGLNYSGSGRRKVLSLLISFVDVQGFKTTKLHAEFCDDGFEKRICCCLCFLF